MSVLICVCAGMITDLSGRIRQVGSIDREMAQQKWGLIRKIGTAGRVRRGAAASS